MKTQNLLLTEIIICCSLAMLFIFIGVLTLIPMLLASFELGSTENVPAIASTLLGSCGLAGIFLLYQKLVGSNSSLPEWVVVALLIIGIIAIPIAVYTLVTSVRNPGLIHYLIPILPVLPTVHMSYISYRAK